MFLFLYAVSDQEMFVEKTCRLWTINIITDDNIDSRDVSLSF